MKIAIAMGFFLPVPPFRGGAVERLWFHLSRHFADAGHKVAVYSRKFSDLPDEEQIDGVFHRRLAGFDHNRRLPVNLALDFIWACRLRAAIQPAEILISNSVFLPIVLRNRKRDFSQLVANLNRMPKGQTRLYGAVDRIQAASSAVMKKVIRENPRLAARCRVFPNAIDYQRLAMPRKTNDDRATIGYIGRLHPEKGVDLLIEAADRLQQDASLPRFRLSLQGPATIAEGGRGPEFIDEVRKKIAVLPRPGDVAIVPPEFDETRLAENYRQIDIFCYPSLAERGEALGVAPLEAMAAGAVPVVSKLDCFRDFLSGGLEEFAFNHHSPDPAGALAAKLSVLLTDPGVRGKLSDVARRKAAQFDYSVIARRHLEDYEALLRRSR